MAKFKVQVRDSAGRSRNHTVEAVNREEVLSNMRRENLTVLSVTPQKEKKGINLGFGGGPPKPRVKAKDLVVFTRQFSTMISAGIPVMECLEIMTDQADDPGFQHVLRTVVEDVASGSDLSRAMGQHPKVFPRIYINMIRAGEASGQLDVILNRLAEYLEAAEALRSRIKSAMTYPVISLVLILGVTIFLMVAIIPKFAKIFEKLKDRGATLPAPTKAVLMISDMMTTYWFISVSIIAGIYILIKTVKKTDKGALMWDQMMLKLPVFGGLFRMVALSRFSRTFSTLIRSGVPILGALEIVEGTVGNRVIERAVGAARDSIRAGESLSAPLAKEPVFPPMVVRMIAIGEKSGALEQLLEKISEFYEQQTAAMVETLTSLIEPLMIALMGLIVGFIVLAVFLPIFELQSAMKR